MTFDYGRRAREIEQHMVDDATARWAGKERPADASGATQPSHGLGHDPVPSEARPGVRTRGEYSPQHHRSLIGQPETEFDRLQRQVGLASIDNEVLRDVLEVAWTTITTLSPTGQNSASDALRARIWAHLHDEEASCGTCDHYVVNHEAAGPCAVFECACQSNMVATMVANGSAPSVG